MDITQCNLVKKIMYWHTSCQLTSSYCSNTVRLICILPEIWAQTALIFTMTTFRSGGLYWRIGGCNLWGNWGCFSHHYVPAIRSDTEWRTGVKQKWRGPLRSLRSFCPLRFDLTDSVSDIYICIFIYKKFRQYLYKYKYIYICNMYINIHILYKGEMDRNLYK